MDLLLYIWVCSYICATAHLVINCPHSFIEILVRAVPINIQSLWYHKLQLSHLTAHWPHLHARWHIWEGYFNGRGPGLVFRSLTWSSRNVHRRCWINLFGGLAVSTVCDLWELHNIRICKCLVLCTLYAWQHTCTTSAKQVTMVDNRVFRTLLIVQCTWSDVHQNTS